MPNPAYLLSDSDALIQLFIAKQGALLACLKSKFGTTLAIVPEIELEVSWHHKFRNQFEAPLQRYIGSGHIEVLDDVRHHALLKSRGMSSALADQMILETQNRSRTYARHVQTGEAYSHGRAVALGLPLMSHDIQAVNTLVRCGLPVASPFLRFADLLVFGRRVGGISKEDCDRVRGILDGQKEWLPAQLRNRKMSDEHWDQFDCRIVTTPAEATERILVLEPKPNL